MRQGPFPPFGFGFSEMGSGEPFKTPFSQFFFFRKKSVFELRVQKDAPGPVSPLRVRIFGVWAPGAFKNLVLGVFRISEKSVFEIRVQKDAPGSVCPLRVRNFGVWALRAF